MCLGQKELASRMNFGMKQFINITSGTIVESAIWKVGYDIQEIEINETSKLLIDNIMKKKKVKDFISWLSTK